MSFDYNKNKHAHSSDSFWTSYSDLFLGLSTIFLLLYVTASLRTGTEAIKSQVDNQKLSMQNEELRNQLKMYESIKSDYLEKGADKDEKQEYEELMDKLTLLAGEAKDEKERLAREALENENKGKALNKYQQMVRNIINANKVAKTKIIARNGIIEEQDTTIEQQEKSISDMGSEIEQKKRLIEEGEMKIAQTKTALDKSKKDLRRAFETNRISKKAFEEKSRALQEANDRKVSDLVAANRSYQSQVSALSSDLQSTQAAAARKEKDMSHKISGLQGALKDSEGALSKAREEMDARREVAREIKRGFAAAGVKADVDMQTGEVVLDFGDAYFESDSSNLKDEMKDVIERAMPAYSRSLFGNPKIADKISAVEVVGFASPTYKGRFVDPSSNKPDDKAALKYNMDLSYRRAKSIFNYLLENKAPEFDHQKNLMSLMKVSGRSFLEVMRTGARKPANAGDFCKFNDCKKAQRVIVRFSMDGKK